MTPMRILTTASLAGLLAVGPVGGARAAEKPKAPAPAAAAPAKLKPAAPVVPPAIEPGALQALQKMSAYLGTLGAFEVKTETTLDLVTADGQRIQLDGGAHYKVRKPNGFVIELVTDMKKRTYYYDGKQFTVFAPELGYYASAPAPATIRETLAALNEKFGISLPLQDLFEWNDGKHAERLQSGFYVGPVTLDGVKTDQYAFRQANVDWQIWIQQGDKPLPLKVAIIDRTDDARPGYVARLAWNTNAQLASDDFAFRPGKDAQQIKLMAAADSSGRP